MKHIRLYGVIIVSIVSLLIGFIVTAQNEFAASLEVLSAGVEVQRVNTANFIAVEIEAIVGVGDIIRTDETGEARITFFADGTDVTLEPESEYRIIEFEGDEEDFNLTVEVIAGQATHRLNRTLGANSSYDVETPGMTLAAQGTVFAIRVEDNGRSGMLVFEGLVDAGADEDSDEATTRARTTATSKQWNHHQQLLLLPNSHTISLPMLNFLLTGKDSSTARFRTSDHSLSALTIEMASELIERNPLSAERTVGTLPQAHFLHTQVIDVS